MAKTHRYAENANKNGNESIVFLDKEISEKIFFYSYIDDYQSVKRKNDSYKTGIPAVFAYLMELKDIKNEEMAEVARITCSTFRSWKSGKKKPDRISLIRFCIRIKLDYYNSCDFDALEDDLNEEISRKKQERQRQQEKEREYEEQNRALPLLRCHDCYNTCLFCHGDMKSSFSGNHLRHYNTYKAHNRCINDKESCCICHYKKGTIVCENCCYYCYKSNPNRRY